MRGVPAAYGVPRSECGKRKAAGDIRRQQAGKTKATEALARLVSAGARMAETQRGEQQRYPAPSCGANASARLRGATVVAVAGRQAGIRQQVTGGDPGIRMQGRCSVCAVCGGISWWGRGGGARRTVTFHTRGSSRS